MAEKIQLKSATAGRRQAAGYDAWHNPHQVYQRFRRWSEAGSRKAVSRCKDLG
jgi:hypothetical protein